MQESASGCGININYSPAKVQERLDDKKLLTGHDVYTLFKLYIYFYATLLLFQCFVIFLFTVVSYVALWCVTTAVHLKNIHFY